MKKILLSLLLLLSFTIFAENKVSISTSRDKVVATISLNESEYITLNERFLFLFIESEEYNFTFSGYPDGVVQENGDIYYSKELTLEGSLILKDGVPPGEYSIKISLGFQTCDKAGICNIPVEISEDIIVKGIETTKKSIVPYISLLIVIFGAVVLLLFRKKRSS